MSTGRYRYFRKRQSTDAMLSGVWGTPPCAPAIVRRRRWVVNLIVAVFMFAVVSPGYISADFAKSADPGTGDEKKVIPRRRSPSTHQEDGTVTREDYLYHEATLPQNLDDRWQRSLWFWGSLVIVLVSLAVGHRIFRVWLNQRS